MMCLMNWRLLLLLGLAEIDKPHKSVAKRHFFEPCGDAVIVGAAGETHLAKDLKIAFCEGVPQFTIVKMGSNV